MGVGLRSKKDERRQAILWMMGAGLSKERRVASQESVSEVEV